MTKNHHYRYDAASKQTHGIDRDAWIAEALEATARLRAAREPTRRRRRPEKKATP